MGIPILFVVMPSDTTALPSEEPQTAWTSPLEGNVCWWLSLVPVCSRAFHRYQGWLLVASVLSPQLLYGTGFSHGVEKRLWHPSNSWNPWTTTSVYRNLIVLFYQVWEGPAEHLSLHENLTSWVCVCVCELSFVAMKSNWLWWIGEVLVRLTLNLK